MPHKIAFMPIMCWLGTTGDENDRERSGKRLNHSRSYIFWSGTGAGTERSVGKTKSELRYIGIEIFRSRKCRLRSGVCY
jgi:hypothetical protein